MRISACYIVKNERDNIRRSIESLQNQYDELIVVDTGSKDGTQDVVRNFGGQVFEYHWKDDFAAARNFALAQASGDWLIFLDADEYFTVDTAGNLRRVLEMASPEADGIFVDMVNFDADTGIVQDHFYQVRLLRNKPGLHYEGIIHEYPRNSKGGNLMLQCVSSELLQIYHTGYRSCLAKEKARRNLYLLQKMVDLGTPENELARYFCDCYKGLGNTAAFLHYGWLEVKQGKRFGNYDSRCHKVLLNYYTERDDWESRASRLRLCEIAVEQFPDLPDFWAEYSESLFQWRRYEEAAEAVDKALYQLDAYEGMEPCQLLAEKDSVAKLLNERGRMFERFSQAAKKCRISACVIVKNEAANIAGWLDNVKAFASELIIVDTGSTDATLDILQENNVRYYKYEWQDDFAAARNFALSKATGDWIVFTDADECFKYPKSIAGALAWLLSNNDKLEAVSVPLCNIDVDNNGALLNTNHVVRFFRHEKCLGYIGKIHERLSDLSNPDRRLVCGDGGAIMTVDHTGYSRCVIATKLQRNLRLMLWEIEQGAKADLYYGYLAECYFGLGYYESALNCALQATQSAWQPDGQQGDAYWLALEAMEILGYGSEDKVVVTENALSVAGDIPDFYGYKGYFLWQRKAWLEARHYLQKAISMYEEEGRDGMTVASHFSQMCLQFHSALADCCYQMGDTALARHHYEAVLVQNKWYEQALFGYLDTFEDWREPNANDWLKNMYNNTMEWEQLGRLLRLNGYVSAEGYGADCNYSEKNVPEQILRGMAVNIQHLFVAVLSRQPDFSSVMLREQLGLLPLSLKSIICVFFGRDDLAGEFSFDDYSSMLSAVLRWGNDDVAEAYVNMADMFGEEYMVQVAGELVEYEKYELALGVLGRIAVDSPVADGSFWFTCGKLLFGQGDYEGAAACLLRVDEDDVKDGEFASYERWCKKKLGG